VLVRRAKGKPAARTGGLVVALGLGVAVATGHGVAWADTGAGDSASGSPSNSGAATTKGASAGSGPSVSSSGDATAKTTSAAHKGAKHAAGRGSAQTAEMVSSAHTAAPAPAPVVGSSGPVRLASSAKTDAPAVATPIAAHTAPVATVSTAAVTPAVVTPAAVSPIATIFALPARIVDAVLGLVGITPAAGNTPTPISPAPIVQLVFAAFREFEKVAGLDSPPAVQPTNTETFTGSLTTPTPTVAQLLDAATAEYVLGGTPGGLTPFTVNGFPVTSTNELTGEAAQVWVTPQNQIIVAYSGTTGGTNLLFNPLIGVTQVLTDAQAVLTRTNPAGTADALRFAQQVETEAAAQGYTPNDIFVTGHSLGAWEAEYVAQNTGLGGIGFESLGLATTVPGNGADSLFVNTSTYGDPASFSSDLPGLQPFAPTYVPGGGIYPHYGPIVMLGDPNSQTPLTNAAQLWGTGIVGDLAFLFVGLGQLFEYHLPSDQAHNLDVNLEPGLLPGSGVYSGPVYTGFGDDTIPEFLGAASTAGILIEP
jgi:hypothetical protein